MRRALAVLVLGVLVACGEPPTPASTTSGVQGTATIGPTCPVVREGEECDDRPVETTLVVLRVVSDDLRASVASVRTAADGTFRVELAPGSYVITADSAEPPGGMRQGVEFPFEVRAGAYTTVDVSFDSGIR